MKLYKMAHVRTGDKSDSNNITVIANSDEDYVYIKDKLTEEKMKCWLSSIIKGEVKRYEVDNLHTLNFEITKSLDGGVTRSLRVDKHGKSLGHMIILREL